MPYYTPPAVVRTVREALKVEKAKTTSGQHRFAWGCFQKAKMQNKSPGSPTGVRRDGSQRPRPGTGKTRPAWVSPHRIHSKKARLQNKGSLEPVPSLVASRAIDRLWRWRGQRDSQEPTGSRQ